MVESYTMNTDFLISELGRLFERSREAIEEDYVNASKPLASEFNELIKDIKREIPENQVVAEIEPVQTSFGRGAPRSRPALHEIRSRSKKWLGP